MAVNTHPEEWPNWVEKWSELAESLGSALARGEDLVLSPESGAYYLSALEEDARDPGALEDAALAILLRGATHGHGTESLTGALSHS